MGVEDSYTSDTSCVEEIPNYIFLILFMDVNEVFLHLLKSCIQRIVQLYLVKLCISLIYTAKKKLVFAYGYCHNLLKLVTDCL